MQAKCWGSITSSCAILTWAQLIKSLSASHMGAESDKIPLPEMKCEIVAFGKLVLHQIDAPSCMNVLILDKQRDTQKERGPGQKRGQTAKLSMVLTVLI